MPKREGEGREKGREREKKAVYCHGDGSVMVDKTG